MNGQGGPPSEALVALNADGIVVVDEAGVCLFCNPSAALLFGRDAADLLGREIGLALGAPDGSEIELITAGEPRTVELLAPLSFIVAAWLMGFLAERRWELVQAVSAKSSRPISILRISEVPAPIS